MTDETKRVTREDLAEAIGDQHWGWLAWTDADTNNPRALRAFRNVADAIFDALPAEPAASWDVVPDCHCQHVSGGRCMFATSAASADVDEARAALLDHFAKVGRFARGGQHATEHVRRVDALIAAVRAESAEALADLERRLAECIVQGAGPAFDAVRTERESADTTAAARAAAYQETIGTTGHLSLAATPAEEEEGRTEPDPFYWEHGSSSR